MSQANGKPVGNVYYGTSSWTDKTLLDSKRFYPPDVDTPAERLRYYSERFPLVEVDSTYYALPSERNAALWIERTPTHFVFNVKAFALLTHHPVGGTRAAASRCASSFPKRESSASTARTSRPRRWSWSGRCSCPRCGRSRRPGRLGAVLFQFPHWFVRSRENSDYLRELAERFPYRIAVEFRGGGWMEDDASAERTLGCCEELGLTYVVVDEPQGFKTSVPPIVAATSPELAMIRFHGHNAENWEKPGHHARPSASATSTRRRSCEQWVEPAQELAGKSEQVHVLMNNCYEDYGVRNAAQIAD